MCPLGNCTKQITENRSVLGETGYMLYTVATRLREHYNIHTLTIWSHTIAMLPRFVLSDQNHFTYFKKIIL